VVDLGTEKVKQVDVIEAEVTLDGPMSHRTYSDLPGSAVVQRSTGAIAVVSSGARQVSRVPITVEGRRVRWTASSPTGFILHGLRMRYRAIGEYFDGSVGGFWESLPIRLGDLAALKDVTLQYQAEQGGRLKISADAFHQFSDLPPAAEWSTITIPLDSAWLEGTLFRFRIESPGPFRLFDGEFRYRPVGTFVSGGQLWELEPVFLGGSAQIWKVEAVLKNTGPVDLAVDTELPGKQIPPRHPATLPAGPRRPEEIRLPGTTRGELLVVRATPASGADVSLYEMRAWVKPTGNTNADWRWIDLPLVKTPKDWLTMALPIEKTSQAFQWIELPVDVIE
jgi:hypothetical protein